MKLELYQEKIFENIKHVDENGKEYWLARELMQVLKYTQWRNFEAVINKAKISCEVSGNNVKNCFADVSKSIISGKGKVTLIKDYKLSRYACYLIVQNGDARKKEVALGQTYFAVQTRKQEVLEENLGQLTEEQKRLKLRYQVRDENKLLNKTVYKIGARTEKEFADFHNAGYQGLYNGENVNDIKTRKGLNETDEVLDYMGNAELAANWFRITQTDLVLENNKMNLDEANDTHNKVGKQVREAMINISGVAPENLPMPKNSIKELEKEELLKITGQGGIIFV